MRRLGPFALAALLAACAHRPAGPAAAPPWTGGARLAFDVGEAGKLLFDIPPGWTATPGELDPPLPATLRLDPPSGHHLFLLTPVLDPAAEPGAPVGAAQVRQLVELARGKAAETAAEAPVLLELGGGKVGWYFAATDRELGPGGRQAEPDEFRCLVQGAAAAGEVLLTFTLLDDGDGPHRQVALEVVRRARHQRSLPAPDAPGAERQPAARPEGWRPVGAEPVTLAYPGKAWALAIDLPGFRLDEPQERGDGRVVSVLGQDEKSGLVASVTLSAAGGRHGAGACAEADWSRLVAAVPELKGRPAPAGERPRADYLVRRLGGRQVDQQNASAWWYRDGVCVHVHVSLMGFEASDQPALDRILASVRYDEPL
jgi:hypothetical protein